MNGIALMYSKASAIESIFNTARGLEEHIRSGEWDNKPNELKLITDMLDYLYAQIDVVFRGSTPKTGEK